MIFNRGAAIMKNTGLKPIWGILFVLLGLALAGRAIGIFNFNIFFNGWWTLFIIVPCALGLSERGHRTSSVIGMGIGFLLLLSAQGVLQWYMFGRILVAFLFIVIGFSIMFRGNHEQENQGNYDYYNNQSSNGQNSNDSNWSNQNYSYDNTTDYNSNNNYSSSNYTNSNYSNSNYAGNANGNSSGNPNGSSSYANITGFLNGRTVQFVDEVFTGAVVTSILGSVQIDLRNAIFNGNAAIETTCILGGVDIYVPSNVKVVNNCTSILAGVDNKVMNPLNSNGELFTLFINGSCILGGIEVK